MVYSLACMWKEGGKDRRGKETEGRRDDEKEIRERRRKGGN